MDTDAAITRTSHEDTEARQPDAWRCHECRRVLAYTDPKKESLRIKYKDFYVHIKGGEVTTWCRGCGAHNMVSSARDVVE